MKISQGTIGIQKGIQYSDKSTEPANVQLVFLFWGRNRTITSDVYKMIQNEFPKAQIVGCTTAGEIIGDSVADDSIVFSALEFRNSEIRVVKESYNKDDEAYNIAQKLATQLQGQKLKGVLTLSDGININGAQLASGFYSILKDDVPVSGGLAGDSTLFERTYTLCNDLPSENQAVAIGFYGDDIQFMSSAHGGWESFGPTRKVTSSKGATLYELDGKPALDLYRKYLGDEAKNLPSSALLFPLTIWPEDQPESAIVRTILKVNEADQSMTFAGDIPEGYQSKFMWAQFDKLVDAATLSAQETKPTDDEVQSLSLIVSCVGRKILMGQRIVTEIEAINKVMGNKNKKIGFYSYGEIAPHHTTKRCELHNETMTITTLTEKA